MNIKMLKGKNLVYELLLNTIQKTTLKRHLITLCQLI